MPRCHIEVLGVLVNLESASGAPLVARINGVRNAILRYASPCYEHKIMIRGKKCLQPYEEAAPKCTREVFDDGVRF